jgi:hypothetical protein
MQDFDEQDDRWREPKKNNDALYVLSQSDKEREVLRITGKGIIILEEEIMWSEA